MPTLLTRGKTKNKSCIAEDETEKTKNKSCPAAQGKTKNKPYRGLGNPRSHAHLLWVGNKNQKQTENNLHARINAWVRPATGSEACENPHGALRSTHHDASCGPY